MNDKSGFEEIRLQAIRIGSVYKFMHAEPFKPGYDSVFLKVTKIERAESLLKITGVELQDEGWTRAESTILIDTKGPTEWKVYSLPPESKQYLETLSAQRTSASSDMKTTVSEPAPQRTSGAKVIAITLGVLAVKIGLLVAFINSQTK